MISGQVKEQSQMRKVIQHMTKQSEKARKTIL